MRDFKKQNSSDEIDVIELVVKMMIFVMEKEF